jgi:basic membrane protein A and related proteins
MKKVLIPLGLICAMLVALPLEKASAAPKKELSIILLIPGRLGDKSFFDSANRGMSLIKEQLGVKTKVVEIGTDSTKWEPSLLDAVEGPYDIIISGNTMTELMNATAVKYPNKRFINFDTSIEATPKNVYSMFYSTNDVGFLAGATAALVTGSKMTLANPDKKIGFLGGMDIPGINDFLVGYIEGARYVDKRMKVFVSYAGSFTDPAKGKELSLVQYNSGVDISYNVAGGTGLGLIDAAKDKNRYAIGVDSDQAALFSDTDPVKAQHILTSTVKNIDQAILRAVKLHIAGTLPYGSHEVLGVKAGGVGLARNAYYLTIPADIRAKLDKITADISSGAIKVDSAFDMTSEQVKALRDSVKP